MSQTITIASKIVEEVHTYNSKEFLDEAKEVVSNPADIKAATTAPIENTISKVAEELEKPNPNILKVVIYGGIIVISLVGTFFGVWFGVSK